MLVSFRTTSSAVARGHQDEWGLRGEQVNSSPLGPPQAKPPAPPHRPADKAAPWAGEWGGAVSWAAGTEMFQLSAL